VHVVVPPAELVQDVTTNPPPSDPGNPGWTLNTLQAHVAQVLAERDARYSQRMDSIERMIEIMVTSQADKVTLALASADKAVLKAEAATEKRFEGVNEFRQALTDQAAAFVTRREFEALRTSGTERMDELKERMDRTTGVTEGGRTRTTDQRAALAAYVGLAGLLISVIIVVATILAH
jgi:hypothetical protein